MKLLKKPVVAVLLTVAIVIASTLMSVNIHFGAKCRQISDGFYDGVYANGYNQKSIASHLENICGYADGLVTIAVNYDLDVSDVREASEVLKIGLRYSKGEVSYIYWCYRSLIDVVKPLEDQLSRADLSERDVSGVERYGASIAGAQSAIESAGYNESVREFMRKYDRFPTNYLAELADVDYPEYFA